MKNKQRPTCKDCGIGCALSSGRNKDWSGRCRTCSNRVSATIFNDTNRVDLSGQKFGRLTVLELSGRKHAALMWLCRCDCGKEKIIRGASLREGITMSCGCYGLEQRTKAIRLPNGEAYFNRLVGEYKQGARNRNLSWGLSNDGVKVLFQGTCFYCGVEPSFPNVGDWSNNYNGLFAYNGIDRVDNTQGYLKENCVSCCGTCNVAKHHLTAKAFTEWIDRLVAYRCKLDEPSIS